MKKGFSYNTPLGIIWIAESGGSITNISFTKPDSFLEEETDLTREAASQLGEYFDCTRKEFELPLNPAGTEFQKKAWNALLQIPYGETRSYKQQAELVGNAKASRAVGMSNNRNPIMIVIPCHRVVGANGSLTGYAGGLDVKRFLLDLENPSGNLFHIKN